MRTSALDKERLLKEGTTNTHFQHNMSAIELVLGEPKSLNPGVEVNFIVAAKNMAATDQLS